MKKRHSEEQIIRILREAERNDTSVREVCRQHNITEQTLYRWRNKHGGMDVADARRRLVRPRRSGVSDDDLAPTPPTMSVK